jgi:TonB family protein
MLRVVLIYMLCVSGWAFAQDDDQKDQSEEQTRRPSWSSGLPEREKTETMSRPGLSRDFKDELTIDRSELGLERPQIDTPEPVVDQQESSQQESTTPTETPTEPIVENQTTPVTEQSEALEPETIPEPQPVVESTPEPQPEPEPEPASYEWQVIQQAEVDFPSRGIRNQINGWVDVEVTLNPQGDVVSTQTVDYSADAGIYVKAAEESLQKWIFQPPQEQGVNNLVSKVYRVDFVPPEITQPVSTQTTTVQDDLSVDDMAADDNEIGQQDSKYQWQVLNRVPLDYPMAAARKRLEGWVDIIVTINPEGEVVSLKEDRYSSRGRIFVEPAKNTLQQWQFEPPKNQGITNNVSRNYRIEFKL